jgi:hypothetical protein
MADLILWVKFSPLPPGAAAAACFYCRILIPFLAEWPPGPKRVALWQDAAMDGGWLLSVRSLALPNSASRKSAWMRIFGSATRLQRNGYGVCAVTIGAESAVFGGTLEGSLRNDPRRKAACLLCPLFAGAKMRPNFYFYEEFS